MAHLLAERKTNADIAAALCLAIHTVENRVSELKERLEARDRVDLVFKCQKLGS